MQINTEMDSDSNPILRKHFLEFQKHLSKLRGGGLSSSIRSQTTARPAVLVHCQQGINRSATLAIAWRMFEAKQGLLRTVRCALEARPIILSNMYFCQQLVWFAAEQGWLVDEDWDDQMPHCSLHRARSSVSSATLTSCSSEADFLDAGPARSPTVGACSSREASAEGQPGLSKPDSSNPAVPTRCSTSGSISERTSTVGQAKADPSETAVSACQASAPRASALLPTLPPKPPPPPAQPKTYKQKKEESMKVLNVSEDDLQFCREGRIRLADLEKESLELRKRRFHDAAPMAWEASEAIEPKDLWARIGEVRTPGAGCQGAVFFVKLHDPDELVAIKLLKWNEPWRVLYAQHILHEQLGLCVPRIRMCGKSSEEAGAIATQLGKLHDEEKKREGVHSLNDTRTEVVLKRLQSKGFDLEAVMVMEYVRAKPVDEYLKWHTAGTTEIKQLFEDLGRMFFADLLISNCDRLYCPEVFAVQDGFHSGRQRPNFGNFLVATDGTLRLYSIDHDVSLGVESKKNKQDDMIIAFIRAFVSDELYEWQDFSGRVWEAATGIPGLPNEKHRDSVDTVLDRLIRNMCRAAPSQSETGHDVLGTVDEAQLTRLKKANARLHMKTGVQKGLLSLCNWPSLWTPPSSFDTISGTGSANGEGYGLPPPLEHGMQACDHLLAPSKFSSPDFASVAFRNLRNRVGAFYSLVYPLFLQQQHGRSATELLASVLKAHLKRCKGSSAARFALMLNVDDTLLKEVSIAERNHPQVQVLRYKPSKLVLEKYAQDLENREHEKPQGKIVHYEIHPDGYISSAVLVRPFCELLQGAEALDCAANRFDPASQNGSSSCAKQATRFSSARQTMSCALQQSVRSCSCRSEPTEKGSVKRLTSSGSAWCVVDLSRCVVRLHPVGDFAGPSQSMGENR